MKNSYNNNNFENLSIECIEIYVNTIHTGNDDGGNTIQRYSFKLLFCDRK